MIAPISDRIELPLGDERVLAVAYDFHSIGEKHASANVTAVLLVDGMPVGTLVTVATTFFVEPDLVLVDIVAESFTVRSTNSSVHTRIALPTEGDTAARLVQFFNGKPGIALTVADHGNGKPVTTTFGVAAAMNAMLEVDRVDRARMCANRFGRVRVARRVVWRAYGPISAVSPDVALGALVPTLATLVSSDGKCRHMPSADATWLHVMAIAVARTQLRPTTVTCRRRHALAAAINQRHSNAVGVSQAHSRALT